MRVEYRWDGKVVTREMYIAGERRFIKQTLAAGNYKPRMLAEALTRKIITQKQYEELMPGARNFVRKRRAIERARK